MSERERVVRGEWSRGERSKAFHSVSGLRFLRLLWLLAKSIYVHIYSFLLLNFQPDLCEKMRGQLLLLPSLLLLLLLLLQLTWKLAKCFGLGPTKLNRTQVARKCAEADLKEAADDRQTDRAISFS